MHGPRPVAGLGPAAASHPIGWLQTPGRGEAVWRALLDISRAGAEQGLSWRQGQQLMTRVVSSGQGQAVLQLGQTALTAKTNLPLPAGAEAQFVVRRLHGSQVELQLVALKTVQDGAPVQPAPGQLAQLSPTTAWQLAFVLPGHGEASVTGLAIEERGERTADQDPADDAGQSGERLVIRWESTHLGSIEIELDVGPVVTGEPRSVRLAARAGPDGIAAVRTGLPELSERLGERGFAVRTRTVSPLRRKVQQTPALRLDARL